MLFVRLFVLPSTCFFAFGAKFLEQGLRSNTHETDWNRLKQVGSGRNNMDDTETNASVVATMVRGFTAASNDARSLGAMHSNQLILAICSSWPNRFETKDECMRSSRDGYRLLSGFQGIIHVTCMHMFDVLFVFDLLSVVQID